MLPILQIGPLAIQLPGLLLLAGVWLGTNAVDKQATRLTLPVATLQNLILLALVAGVVGARFGYAARYLDVYLENPLGLLSLQPATLSPWIGLLTGIVAAWSYGQRKELPFWLTLDALASGLAVFSLFVGISHLASGDAFGAPANVPWAIELWGALRHPSQVYEILAAGCVLIVVQQWGRQSTYTGVTFLVWVALTASSRLFLEAFRGDSVLLVWGIRSAQVVALGVLLAALAGLRWLTGESAGGLSRAKLR